MENNKNIDDLFKEIVEPSEMDHSTNVWTSLENHLEKKSSERDKGIIFQLRIAVGLLLFLLGSFTVYYLLSPKTSNSKLLVVNEQGKARNSNKLPKVKETQSKQNVNVVTPSLNPQQKTTQVNGVDATEIKQNTKSNLKVSSFVSDKTHNSTKILPKSSTVPADLKLTDDTQGNSLLAIKETPTKDSVSKNEFVENPVVTVITDTISAKTDSSKMILPIDKVATTFSKEKLDSIQKQQLKNKLSIMAYFSPDITMKYLKDNDNTDNQSEGDYNNNEVPDFSYNTGLLVGYDLSKNLAIKFGVSYAYIAQTIKPKVVYAKTGTDGLAHYQFNTTYGTSELPRDQTPVPIIGDSININTNSTQSFKIIGVPLITKYQVSRKKFDFYAQAGVSLNFLMSEKLIVETQNKVETIKNIEGLNEYYFGGILGLGVSYSPIRRFSILLEPTLKGAITPINKNTPITTRPISFGLSLGFGWHF